MNYSEKEIGHMTFEKFLQLYEAYKKLYSLEKKMEYSRITYEDLEQSALKKERIVAF